VGNPGHVALMRQWLRDWNAVHVAGRAPAPAPSGAKKDMSKKALLLSGPPGIGKTTAAHVLAKYEKARTVASGRRRVRRAAARSRALPAQPGLRAATRRHSWTGLTTPPPRRELGLDVVEVNASDARNKSDKKVKGGIDGKLSNRMKELVTNTAIGDGTAPPRRQVIVMDEVDGMSGVLTTVDSAARHATLRSAPPCSECSRR